MRKTRSGPPLTRRLSGLAEGLAYRALCVQSLQERVRELEHENSDPKRRLAGWMSEQDTFDDILRGLIGRDIIGRWSREMASSP
jgi:hypothetical protein